MTYITFEKTAQQTCGRARKLRSHLNVTISDHLQLLKFILITDFEWIDTTEHLVDH